MPDDNLMFSMRYACFAAIILLLAYPLPAYSAPVIDRPSSHGAYLVKTRSGMNLMAEVNIADARNIVKTGAYSVEMIMPDGKKMKLRLMGCAEDMLVFAMPALLLTDEVFKSGGLTGDYIFILSDDNGKVLDTYSDFLVPFRDYTGEGMGDFDEAYISPQNGAVVKIDSPKEPRLIFKWNKVKGAVRYRLRIYKRETLVPPQVVHSEITETTEVVVPLEKFTEDKYYWRLEALHEEDNDWDNTARYTLDGVKRPFFYIK